MLTRRNALRAGAAGLLLPNRSIAWTHGKAASVSPFVITPIFGPHWASAPAGATACVNGVIALFQKLIWANCTVVINFDYGFVGGQAVTQIAQSLVGKFPTNYTAFRNAYLANVMGPDMTAAAAQLPVSDPTSGTAFWLAQTVARSLGLTSNTAQDGFFGVNSGITLDTSGGPTIVGYDFCQILAHEISEILGRYRLANTSISGAPGQNSLDMFAYTAPGTRTLVQGGYFSLDGGTTDLNDFSGSADPGDWSGSFGLDACNAFGTTDTTEPMGTASQRAMAAAGWQTHGPVTWDTTGL